MATIDPYVLQQILRTQIPANQRTSTQKQTETGTETVNQQNMSPVALAALDQYIQQLMGGGTSQMRQSASQRNTEVKRTRAQQDAYSKDAAFADAQGLMNQYIRQTMEKNMPTLVRAAEGAGTSANSMRALMAQQLQTQAAEGAAAQGLQAAGQYGQVATGFGAILERLTQTDPVVAQALANAFGNAKGAVQNTTRNTTGTRTTDTTMSNLEALARLAPTGTLGGTGPRSISAGSAPVGGAIPHSFPAMAGLTGGAEVAGGNAGYSHIFSQQAPGQGSLPVGYNAGGSTMPQFTTPAADTAFWSGLAGQNSLAQIREERPDLFQQSAWDSYGQVD